MKKHTSNLLLLFLAALISCDIISKQEKAETIEQWIIKNAATEEALAAARATLAAPRASAPVVYVYKNAYHSGDSIYVILNNITAQSIRLRTAEPSLEKKTSGVWKPVSIGALWNGIWPVHAGLPSKKEYTYVWNGTLPNADFTRKCASPGVYRFSFEYWTVMQPTYYPVFPTDFTILPKHSYYAIPVFFQELPQHPGNYAYSKEFEIKPGTCPVEKTVYVVYPTGC